MLKTIKIPTITPTCFGSLRNHNQGATSCLAERDPDTHRVGVLVGLTAGLDGLDERSLAPAGIPTPDHPARSLVTIPTELSRFK